MRRSVIAFVCLLGGCWLAAQVWLFQPHTAVFAQDKSKKASKAKKGSSNVLDVKANEIQGEFVKSAEELANDYYKLGEFDKARMLLRSIQALEPNRPGLDDKLKRLDEDLINDNEVEVDLNAARGWEMTGILVTAGKPIRLKTEGNYKMVLSLQMGPAGFAAPKEPSTADMVNDLPLGSVIGIIIPPDRQAGIPVPPQDDNKKEKKERAFLIGEGVDYTPNRDGMLYIRVNTPPENKNTGKLKVTVSGGMKVGK